MKRRKSVSLLLAGTTTVAMLTGPVQAAEAPSPQELAAKAAVGRRLSMVTKARNRDSNRRIMVEIPP